MTALRERHDYLAAGGEFQRLDDEDRYLAGFRDAMKVLEVKP